MFEDLTYKIMNIFIFILFYYFIIYINFFFFSFSLFPWWFIVRCRRCLPRWTQRIPHSWACRGRIQWCWGPCYPYSYWDHHPCHSYPKRSRRERSSYPWVNLCCSKTLQLPRWLCWVIRWESCSTWSLRHCPMWVSPLQTPRRSRCPQSLLRCHPLHYGVWS